MRDYHLRFYSNRWPHGIIDLLGDTPLTNIPETGGAYILGSTDNIDFIYPWGRSPIFYIGKAHNLRKRLRRHRRNILKVVEDHEETHWWPRYQFGASFGTTLAWFSTSGRQTPEGLEADLINQFYWVYGSIPVANGSWPSGLTRPTIGSRDDR
jgi:hypothetical protein